MCIVLLSFWGIKVHRNEGCVGGRALHGESSGKVTRRRLGHKLISDQCVTAGDHNHGRRRTNAPCWWGGLQRANTFEAVLNKDIATVASALVQVKPEGKGHSHHKRPHRRRPRWRRRRPRTGRGRSNPGVRTFSIRIATAASTTTSTNAAAVDATTDGRSRRFRRRVRRGGSKLLRSGDASGADCSRR